MGGAIDWSAMDSIVALYDIQDVPLFIDKLEAIREHVKMIQDMQNGK